MRCFAAGGLVLLYSALNHIRLPCSAALCFVMPLYAVKFRSAFYFKQTSLHCRKAGMYIKQ